MRARGPQRGSAGAGEDAEVLSISASDAWRETHPGAIVGLLELSGVNNDRPCPRLEAHKRSVEATLRTRHAGSTRRDLLAHPVMGAYAAYYRRFSKTYHVQLQVESIALKGKALPSVSPAVDANFAAEVETFVLAAGHDAGRLVGPVLIDVSRDGDQMEQMNGSLKTLRAADMIMRDAEGIRCSILYGQDARSSISSGTTRVLYVVYGPPGVPAGSVERHLGLVEALVRLCSPEAALEQRRVLGAPPAAGESGR